MNSENMKNFYERMDVDIELLFRKNIKPLHRKRKSFICRIIKRYSTAFLIMIGCYSRFVDAGIIREWFEEFRNYWSNVLNGRPLYLHDFFFLLGIYRTRYQEVEVLKGANKQEFLDAWQNEDTLYQLFGAVRRYAYEPLHCYQFEKWINHGDSILEYGCGIAPISHSLMKYSTKRKLKITIADICQINSHFAIWRLGTIANFIKIEPYETSLPYDCYDIAFMITVMEHLPDPLEVIINVTNSLKSGGILVFDYIISDGEGLDTIEAVKQRSEVIQFIRKKYNLVLGGLFKNKSMGTTICKRK